MAWHFPRQPASMVEQDITQRDQFSNDDVALSETIIRESVQNSLDASVSNETKVKVSFRFMSSDDGLDGDFLREVLEGQLPHARAAGIDLSGIDFSSPTALVIEDFGTKGLTGSTTDIDNENFSDFWRRHGKSHKTGISRGRWGLGKLVYSTTSELGVFFGATSRFNEETIKLMGQTVLKLHSYEGHRYPPHAFFCDMTSSDPQDGMPKPLEDLAFVQKFVDKFELQRGGQPGLSVVIPFPNRLFKLEEMIGVAIKNYFYPLITGQLILQFGDQELNKDNVRELAQKYARNSFQDITQLFDFVEGAYSFEESKLLELKASWSIDKKLDQNDFEYEDLERIRSQFINGELIGLQLPLELKKKDKTTVKTDFKVFIQKPEGLGAGIDLYVRGGLTVPNERKFGSRKALGAMIAEKQDICAFLGDAENAAHTKWIASAEKLLANYQSPGEKIKVIKNVVLNLYDMLAQDLEEQDERGLAKFFSVSAEKPDKKKRKRGKRPIIVVPKPKNQRIVLSRVKGGFRISSPEGVDPNLYPCIIKVRAAYDVVRGNAFKKYDPQDFTFSNSGGMKVSAEGTCTLTMKSENRLEIVASAPFFKISVNGFDEARDVTVDVRAEAEEDEANS
jgi:hypothetical protein